MHRVRMLRTVPGSYDGFTPMTWHKGSVYHDITDELLKCFIELGAVEMVDDAPEQAAVTAAPEAKPARAPRRPRNAL
jgi:hypothetical protein